MLVDELRAEPKFLNRLISMGDQNRANLVEIFEKLSLDQVHAFGLFLQNGLNSAERARVQLEEGDENRVIVLQSIGILRLALHGLTDLLTQMAADDS
jgi:hypothetical protein